MDETRRDPAKYNGQFSDGNRDAFDSDAFTWNDYENHWTDSYVNSAQNGDNVVSNWWNSDQTASKDFSRQMVAQMYQNYWESAPEQMKRLKEAGVNLNFAAGSVAGSAGGASPMSAPQADANNPITDVANLANAVTGGIGNLANAGKAVAETGEIQTLLPLKGASLHANTLLSLENIGLTKAQAQSVSIANQYAPAQFQLGIAKMRLELPMMLKQMRVIDSEYENNMSQAKLFDQQVEESKASVSLMDYQAMKLQADARKANAEANLINKRFELLRSMNWDPFTGFEGLFGTYLANPHFTSDDVNNLADNLTNFAYQMARFKFLGDNNLSLDDGKSLFEHNVDEAVDISYGSRKDIPASVKVGPFETSTNLRDFLHQHNHKVNHKTRYPNFGHSFHK